MFNILSGLQAGSHSVVLVSRAGAAGLVKGACVQTGATGNTVAAADSSTAAAPFFEYVFEDLLTQTSGKYTTAYGNMEAETDQFDGSPAIGAYLKPGTGATAGKLVAVSNAATDAAIIAGKVVDTYSLPVNPTLLAGVGGVATSVLRVRLR